MSIVSWDIKYAYNNWSGPSGAEDSFVVDNDTSADADAFSLSLDGTPPAPDAAAQGGYTLYVFDGFSRADADSHDFVVESVSTAPAEDSVHLLGTSDALAPTDFFLV